MRTLLLFSSICLLTLACEKEIPLEQEEIQPRIVVNGLFVAGDTIRIHLSESRDVLYDGALPDLPAATAKFYNGNDDFLGDFVYEGFGVYRLDNYVPVAGATYKIKVSNPGFEDVSGQTNTPDIIAVNSIDTLRQGNEMNYEIKFSDPAGETNYYAVTVELTVYYENEFGQISYYTSPEFQTTEIYPVNGYSDGDGTKYGSIFLFSDATFNGGECSFSCSNHPAPAGSSNDSFVVVVNVRTLSEDYYKYHVSRAKYQETEGDPFAQPVQVYSNIENGFGIFGAYSGYTDTLFLP